MIGDTFQPRRRLRASQLNELARSADSAHLGAAGFLSQENGLEQVARSPRRATPVAQAAIHGMQWRITAKKVEGGVAVSVGAGLVAWGGGITYINNGADLGELAPGEEARVVWITSAPPIALVNDPRWPKGDAPDCGCRDCDCRDETGDPSAGGGDSGALLLVAPDWTPPDGFTDAREIGTVSVSETGRATVGQLQRDTIVARAIVGRDPDAVDPPEEVPPCGHPLNNEGANDTNPIWSGNTAGGGGHPLDSPGDGGYTPLCADDAHQVA